MDRPCISCKPPVPSAVASRSPFRSSFFPLRSRPCCAPLNSKFSPRHRRIHSLEAQQPRSFCLTIPLFIFSIQKSPYFRILLTVIALQDVEKHILGHFLALARKVPRHVHIGNLVLGLTFPRNINFPFEATMELTMRRWFGFVLATTLLAVSAYGQTFRGAINGTVTDPSGAVVAGANVKATNAATGVSLNTVTTNEGQF